MGRLPTGANARQTNAKNDRSPLSRPTSVASQPRRAIAASMNWLFAAADAPFPAIVEMKQSVMGRLFAHFSGHDSTTLERILLIAGLAAVAHLTVKLTRSLSDWL